MQQLVGPLAVLGVHHDEPFITITSVESQTDDVPRWPPEQALSNEEALLAKDAHLADWLSQVKPKVLEACCAVVERFGWDRRPRVSLKELPWHVMDATADDWESLDQIEPHVRRFCGDVNREAIANMIIELRREGLLEEMQHSSSQHDAREPEQLLQEPFEHWFQMTTHGRAMWDAEGSKYRKDKS